MTFKKILTLFVISSLMINIAIGANTTKTGTTAAKFLAIGVGAKANGMGNAFVGIADDASALYWNPAGVASFVRTELSMNYTDWFAGINYSNASIILPLGGRGVVGVNTSYVDMGEMEITTETYPEGTGEYYSASSYAIGLSYASKLTDRFSIGGNLKMINESIANCNARGVALDLGTLYITPFKDIRFGVSVSNFGTKLQMTGDDLLVQKDIDENHNGNNESVNAYLATEEFDLPLLLRIGFAGDINIARGIKCTWALDAAHPNDNSEYVNTGIQISFLEDKVFLRSGLKKLFMDSRDEKLSVGGGLNIPLSGMIFSADYAYQSFERLGYVHKYSISMKF